MYHVQRAEEIALEPPGGAFAAHTQGLRRAALVGRSVGAVHTGFALAELDPGGSVGTHVHSYEQSFYVLDGEPRLTVDGRTYRLAPHECGLIPVGVPHAWRAGDDGAPGRWLEMSAPTPREGGPPDTFFTSASARTCTACSWSSTSPAAWPSPTTTRSRRRTTCSRARSTPRPMASASRCARATCSGPGWAASTRSGTPRTGACAGSRRSRRSCPPTTPTASTATGSTWPSAS